MSQNAAREFQHVPGPTSDQVWHALASSTIDCTLAGGHSRMQLRLAGVPIGPRGVAAALEHLGTRRDRPR